MVGYTKYDSMTTNQKLIAGVLAGVTTRFITQPLDIIKLRTQLQKRPKHKRHKKPKTMVKTATRILSEEGYTAFWQGHVLGQAHSILSVSSQFYMFELATKYAAGLDLHDPYRSIATFMCGILAGCCSTTLVIPLEVIRVRQMLIKDQYGGLIKGAAAVYRYGGILAFYEGLSASLLQMGPQVGVSFSVFSIVQPMILRQFHTCDSIECRHKKGNKHDPSQLVIASSIAGSVAGFVAKTVTYPFDLAKRRLQISSHRTSEKYDVPSTSRYLFRCRNLTDCLVKTVRKEGFRGLFRGWGVTVYKAQVTSVCAYTTYELFCYAIRETNK